MSDPLTIHGVVFSQPTRSIIAYCKLSNIPYAFKNVDIKNGENLGPEYTAINPF